MDQKQGPLRSTPSPDRLRDDLKETGEILTQLLAGYRVNLRSDPLFGHPAKFVVLFR